MGIKLFNPKVNTEFEFTNLHKIFFMIYKTTINKT